MTSIHEIFTTFGPEYLQRYATAMPKTHRKVIDAIMACRTEACGIAFYQCESCAEPRQFYRSCGNRHCPTCQHNKTQQWLRKQIERQLPGHHFLITFTVPEQLRSFMRQHQRAGYSALFKASSDAIKKLALYPKYIGADLPGFFGVLHTWGRTLQYHPHIHYIVCGGALRSADGSWHPSQIDFFLPVKALSVIFRAKFRNLMEQAKLFDPIPPDVWQIDWNVNSQAVTSSDAALKYLAPYVFKVAISNSRIVKVQDRIVLIRYRKPHSERPRILALDVMEFIRRFLQHVLPTGFMKIRYYGFINPNCVVPLDRIRGLIELSYGFAVDLPTPEVQPRPLSTCPSCGGLLKLRSVLPPLKILRRSG
jgi:Putative transposase/Transposase zinc-binding domain